MKISKIHAIDLKGLADKWPSAIVSRDEIERFSGGALSSRYLANLDSKKKGPKGRFRLGRKVCYPVPEVVRWFEARAQRLD
jgi:hypothetical protein